MDCFSSPLDVLFIGDISVTTYVVVSLSLVASLTIVRTYEKMRYKEKYGHFDGVWDDEQIIVNKALFFFGVIFSLLWTKLFTLVVSVLIFTIPIGIFVVLLFCFIKLVEMLFTKAITKSKDK